MDIGMARVRPRNKFYLSFTLLLFLLAHSLAAQATIVFLNELHYDNTGSDSGEGFELAGTAGTDLSGWQVLLYNGVNGEVYRNVTLGGIIPDMGAGMGVSFFGYAGIQNGSPDGLAIVDNNNMLLQFLSYEGAFTATQGPAAGESSSDIGIFEGSSTLVGRSLQLTGSGMDYGDFRWISGEESFGLRNTGQVFSSRALPAPGTTILIVTGLICGAMLRRRRAA